MKVYPSLHGRTGPGRTALLIDLENLSYSEDGVLISPSDLGVRLDEVLTLAGPVHYRLVAAQRHVLVRYGAELAARNLRWQVCRAGPDEADRALTEAGRELLLRGFGRIVVASGDHYFAPFGALCDLRVAVPRGVDVSARLASAAATVMAPPDPLGGACCGSALPSRPGVPVPTAA
jgi:hypothetical protein